MPASGSLTPLICWSRDRRLAESPYIAGDEYTIADMAIWPWYGTLAKGQLYDAGEFLQVQDYTHVLRWTINEVP